MTHVKKNCLACSGIIQVRLADHKRGWGKFCNKSCKAAYSCGYRPHDVNAGHTQMKWAVICHEVFEELYGKGGKPPKAPSIKEQIGKNVKAKSPKRYVKNDKRVFSRISDDDWINNIDVEGGGWDAHKDTTGSVYR